MDEGFDTGDIIDVCKVQVVDDETGYSLYEKLVDLAPQLLKRYLPDLFLQPLARYPQDKEKGSYYPKRLPNNGKIDWNWDTERIIRFVRAIYHPVFGSAWTYINGKKLEILEVSSVSYKSANIVACGTFITNNGSLLVRSPNAYLCVLKIRDFRGKVVQTMLDKHFMQYYSG
jgi:methionyl-tRNA formyltransferase